MDKPLISIVITTHGSGYDVPVILGSIKNQREYEPGKDSNTGREYLWASKDSCTLEYETIVVWDGERIVGADEYHAHQIILCPKEGGVGHHTREPGIKAANGEWIVLTNSDNYFCSGWLHRISGFFAEDVGMVTYDCLNNLWRWSNYGGTKLLRGHIDLSAAVVRADVAKKVGFPWRNYDGDWDYIKACLRECQARNLKVAYVDETLCVHN